MRPTAQRVLTVTLPALRLAKSFVKSLLITFRPRSGTGLTWEYVHRPFIVGDVPQGYDGVSVTACALGFLFR